MLQDVSAEGVVVRPAQRIGVASLTLLLVCAVIATVLRARGVQQCLTPVHDLAYTVTRVCMFGMFLSVFGAFFALAMRERRVFPMMVLLLLLPLLGVVAMASRCG